MRRSPGRRWSALLAPVLWSGCAGSPASELYRDLALCAEDPAMRGAVCWLVADDQGVEGRDIAWRYRADPDPAVRAACRKWLLCCDPHADAACLLEGLCDPAPGVQATSLLYADRVTPWSEAVWGQLWTILGTCELGHVFDKAALAAVQRGGAVSGRAVYQLLGRRGMSWWPHAVRALASCPDEDYRYVFELAAESDEHDLAILGRRGLHALDAPDSPSPTVLTELEFRARPGKAPPRGQVPVVVPVAQLVADVARRRVVVLGELHAWPIARARQIEILGECVAARGAENVVLLPELAVREYQEPVIAAARQWGVEVRFLEEEPSASHDNPFVRDELVQTALVAAARAAPEKTLVVCYGNNHRASLQQALRDAGIDVVGVALYTMGDMLGAAMRVTGGRLRGLAFGFDGDVWFVPCGSYASMLGSKGFDEHFYGDAR